MPIAIADDQWIGFDDERSIREKMKYIIDNNYAGSMIWTIDMDDFHGECSGIKYPLISIMAEMLIGKPRASGSKIAGIVKKAEIVPIKLPPPSITSPTLDSNLVINKAPTDGVSTPVINNSALLFDDKYQTNARVVCYITNWSIKRPNEGKFDPALIDPFLCTHIIYAFANLKGNKIVPLEHVASPGGGVGVSDIEMYKKITGLKEKNPRLKVRNFYHINKYQFLSININEMPTIIIILSNVPSGHGQQVLLAVGGWMVGPTPFKELTENVYRQTLFTFSTIEYLREYNFDGLDLCWEFPRGAEDKDRYVIIIVN